MISSRAALKVGTAAAAGILYALPAIAQTPADGAVEQALQNTVAANLQRRGYALTDPVVTTTTTAVQGAVTRATNTGSTLTGVQSPSRTWAETIKGWLNTLKIQWPLTIGKAGQEVPNLTGGGTFGGGGASGTWGDIDCSDIKVKFDAQNYLVIPSFSLEVGSPITFNSGLAGYRIAGFERAKTPQATVRWMLHDRLNKNRIPQSWFGVIGASGSCVTYASVAYRDANNVVIPRESGSACVSSLTFLINTTGAHGNQNPIQELQCPVQAGTGGSEVHFYGNGLGWANSHNHQCTEYVPTPQAGGEGGYFINKETSVNFKGTEWPALMAPSWKQCLVDPSFIKKIADAAFKDASEQVGYTGAPYSPILDEDSRPDGVKVDDLADEPTTGTRPAPNETAVNVPPPAPPPSPPPTTGTPTDILGTDPNIGTPSDPEAPTNIMAPVFDWLPDLPNIQLNTAGAQCPTWEMQPFDGPEWHLVMDKHCPFIADNAALISTIMILGFTVGSAMIILRA